MRKVIMSLVMFAVVLSLGAGISVMFAERAVAEAEVCIITPVPVWVNTGTTCWVVKYVTQGTLWKVYAGLTEESLKPCGFLYSVCIDGRQRPGNVPIK